MDTIINTLFSAPALNLIILIGVFIAVALLAYALMPDARLSAAKKMLGVVDDNVRENKILLLKILHPALALLATRIRTIKSSWVDRYKQRRSKRLITADLQREITPDEFIAFKIVMMIVFPALAHYLATIVGKPMPTYAYLLLPLLGFFAPEFWLLELQKKRRRAIFQALPYTIDLLTLSVEAGLDFIAAIQRVTSRSKTNPLIEELKVMLGEISLGTSRADALRHLAARLQMEEINSFTTLLIQADQLGASIGPVLRAQADSLRTSRFQKAEIAGARASQLILFPMIFCIFPAVFIIVIGPLIVKFLLHGLAGTF